MYQDHQKAGERLLQVIQDVANGNYSNDIMELTKDDVPEHIRTVAEAMGMMMVKVEAREYRLEQLVAELRELNQAIRKNSIATVSAMAHALAARDEYTEGHTSRVGELAVRMALAMGMTEEEAEFVQLGGVLHDIGKIGFPDALFNDHGKKNPPELVKQIIRHPKLGAAILKDLDFLGPALEYVHCHHERLDGSGYPRHLKGDEIPLGAQILYVADTYDAITTDRPYQKGSSPREALGILRQMAEKGKVNPQAVEALAGLVGGDSAASG